MTASPSALSTKLESLAEFARILETRLEYYQAQDSISAHLSQDELQARLTDVRRETYQQVVDWSTDSGDGFAVQQSKLALQALSAETDEGDAGSTPAPPPPPSPSPGPHGPRPLTRQPPPLDLAALSAMLPSA